MSDFNAVEIDGFCSSFVNQQPLPVQVFAGKRSCVPDGSTPGKCKPKQKGNEKSGGARKSLFSAKGPIQHGCNTDKKWTTEETAALVQHICLYWDNATQIIGQKLNPQNCGMTVPLQSTISATHHRQVRG